MEFYFFTTIIILLFCEFIGISANPQECDKVCIQQVCPEVTPENCDGIIIPKSCGQCCPICQPNPRRQRSVPRIQCKIYCPPNQCREITADDCIGNIIPAHSPCNCCPYCQPSA